MCVHIVIIFYQKTYFCNPTTNKKNFTNSTRDCSQQFVQNNKINNLNDDKITTQSCQHQ